jgi:hypothetical protein
MKIIFLIIVLVSMPGKNIESAKGKTERVQISYYWFDTSLNYIRQNTLLTEATITGYNNNTDNPKTLRELGFAPVNCTGTNPPVPNDPELPDQRFYSHP